MESAMSSFEDGKVTTRAGRVADAAHRLREGTYVLSEGKVISPLKDDLREARSASNVEAIVGAIQRDSRDEL